MAGMNATSRLEAKDKKIEALKGRLQAATEKIRELRAKTKGGGRAVRVIGTGDAQSTSKPSRPRTSKGRTRAPARSASRRKTVAPSATA